MRAADAATAVLGPRCVRDSIDAGVRRPALSLARQAGAAAFGRVNRMAWETEEATEPSAWDTARWVPRAAMAALRGERGGGS